MLLGGLKREIERKRKKKQAEEEEEEEESKEEKKEECSVKRGEGKGVDAGGHEVSLVTDAMENARTQP